jgi:hypothetical protein
MAGFAGQCFFVVPYGVQRHGALQKNTEPHREYAGRGSGAQKIIDRPFDMGFRLMDDEGHNKNGPCKNRSRLGIASLRKQVYLSKTTGLTMGA